MKKLDLASLFFSVLSFILLFSKHFMFKAKARIGVRTNLSASASFGSWYTILLVLFILLIILVFLKSTYSSLNWVVAMTACGLFLFTLFLSGQAAYINHYLETGNRVSWHFGAYTLLLSLLLIQTKCITYITIGWQQLIVYLTGIIGSIFLLLSGNLSQLAVIKEYTNYRDQFWVCFDNHISMTLKVVFFGILVGIPLGWLAYHKKKFGKVLFLILNTIESIPALALLCVMMFPLSYISNHTPFLRQLGIAGVGFAPVFCALSLYSLYQIVNSTYGALKVLDKKYIDVAQGLGMTRLQISYKVELPLILPIIISGVRISLIATILGVTIGSYIGYGGLGKFILQGLNGFAIDLVMLGTLPIMGLILGLDSILKKLEQYVSITLSSKESRN